jgi:integrase/recombinase XerD
MNQQNQILLDKFLRYHQDERGHSSRTVQTYKEILSDCLGTLADPLTCKYEQLREYLGRFRHLSVNYQNQKIATLKSFFNWLRAYQGRPDNPMEKVYTIKGEEGKTLFIPPADFAKIIEKAKPRDRLMWSLCYKCGLRLSEVLSLSRDNLLPENKSLRINGKGNHTRYIPVPDSLWSELLDFSSFLITQSPFLFLTRTNKPMNQNDFYSIWHRRMRNLGMKYTPHSLRHGCATNLLNNGANIREVQELLGHKSITMTSRYTHVSLTQLRELVNKEV